MAYLDNNGYKRGEIKHSNLLHRQLAFKYIYQPNKDQYPLPFGQYQVHHIDGNKQNNDIKNLKLVSKESHKEIHISKKELLSNKELAKLYWTTNSLIKAGIIILEEKGIFIYSTKKIILIGPKNLREKLHTAFSFDDLINVTTEIGLLGSKRINIFITEKAFQREVTKSNKLIQKIASLNTERVFTLDTNSDSKAEILDFVRKANELIKLSK